MNAVKVGPMAIRLEDKEKLFLEQLDDEGMARGNKRLRESLGWGERGYLEVRAALLRKGQIALGRGRGGSVKKAFGDEQMLLAAVPLEGSISNPKMIERLGWSHEHYWEVHNRLIEEGQIVASRGPGGAISRVQDEVEEEVEEEEAEEERVRENTRGGGSRVKREREECLYAPLVKTLKSKWAQSQQLEQAIVESCANVKNGKGMWRNPDLLMVGRHHYELIVAHYLIEIWTFEVKPTGWNLKAIFEAEANGHGSTHSCALLQVDKKGVDRNLAECEAKAAQLKVGLITFVDPSDVRTWQTHVKPEKRADNFVKQNLFLKDKMSQEGQAQMKAWSRSDPQAPQSYGKFTCSG